MSKWYNEAVFYHIYPLGLTGAPKENRDGGVCHRMEELFPWIEHIRELGGTAIYIGPLFESTSHGYDTKDYRIVDKRLGDNEDFKKFVRLAHEAGIRVVVDGVFNHTGREFFAFRDIQQNREGSRYCSWYKGVNFGWNTPYNDGFGYEAWRNCFELVNLNLWNQEVRDYLLDVIRFWIQEFDIDGIRLDCADCLDFEFMKQMRQVTAQEKEDFWLMGEVIHGDYARWANDEMLHSVTNYELHKGLYSGHNDHNYFEIAHTIRREFDENGGIYKGRTLYSFVDNHDVSRIASILTNEKHLPLIYAICFGMPGIPCVYYGSEWGAKANKSEGDPALRASFAEPVFNELSEFISKLAEAKKNSEALNYGAFRSVVLTNKQCIFERKTDQERVLVAVNADGESFTAHFDAGCGTAVDLISGEAHDFGGGSELPPYSAYFWKMER